MSAEEDFEKGYDAFGRNDFNEAIEWFFKAAEQGHIDALFMLGQINAVFLKSYDEAAKFYATAVIKAEKKGETCEKAIKMLFELAYEYDGKEALKALKFFAENGNEETTEIIKKYAEEYDVEDEDDEDENEGPTDAKEQFELGQNYLTGRGVPEDSSKAVYWFTKAAEQGDMMAQHYLGLCYGIGKVVPQDIEKAIYWFTKAAEQGNSDAKEYIAKLKSEGKI